MSRTPSLIAARQAALVETARLQEEYERLRLTELRSLDHVEVAEVRRSVGVGKERGDVTDRVVDLSEKLDPEGKRPGFQHVVIATEDLGEPIGKSRLFVIDDVGPKAPPRPLLRGWPRRAQSQPVPAAAALGGRSPVVRCLWR